MQGSEASRGTSGLKFLSSRTILAVTEIDSGLDLPGLLAMLTLINWL